MNASKGELIAALDLIARLEVAVAEDQPALLQTAIRYAHERGWIDRVALVNAIAFIDVGAFLDAALSLVPEGWTRAVDATAPELGIDVDLFATRSARVSGDGVRGTHTREPIATVIACLKARFPDAQ